MLIFFYQIHSEILRERNFSFNMDFTLICCILFSNINSNIKKIITEILNLVSA
jgi:hypothetical protein